MSRIFDFLGIAMLALIIIIMVAFIRKPSMLMFATGAMLALLYIMCRPTAPADGFDDAPPTPCDAATQPPDVSISEQCNTFSAGPCAERRAEPAPLPDVKATATKALISRSNLFSLNQIYGRRYDGTIDSALYPHKQRIGDRDRQATIIQVKSRRNNVYEPYYRQELSEHNSKRWWEPDDSIVTKLERRQLATIDMGRQAVWNYDVDGIYDQR